MADDNFKCIFQNQNDGILNWISPNFVPRSPTDSESALVQVMAWRQRGDKPLPDPILMHISGTRGDETTHWDRVMHICISRLTITGSENGLSPGRRQAIIWTNAGILLIGPLGTNFSENLIEILTFSFTKMRLKESPAKWRPFCLRLNMLILYMGLGFGHPCAYRCPLTCGGWPSAGTVMIIYKSDYWIIPISKISFTMAEMISQYLTTFWV